jgi:hypothetical protein
VPCGRCPAPSAARAHRGRIGGEHGEGHVDIARPERTLPVRGSALPRVVQLLGARGHAGPKLRREGVKRRLRHPESLQPSEGEGDGEPCALIGAVPARRRCHVWQQSLQHLASVRRIVDPQQEIGPQIGRWSLPQDDALDVTCVQLTIARVQRGRPVLRRHGHSHSR